jgi:hypothetical protein
MVNRHRGEVSATLDGKRYRLILTLGALAELETAFGAEDMVALAARFDSGRLKAQDCVRIIAAGLRGAGYTVEDAEVATMQTEAGAAGFVTIVADLLAATFANQGPANAAEGDERSAGPFPGTT